MKRNNPFHDIYHTMNYDNLHNPIPHMMDIELTNHCNLRCNMCNRQIMTRPQGYMTDDTFYQILDEAWKHHIPLRFIRWGEPFLHEKILEYAKDIKDWSIPLHITTNGMLLKEKTIHTLLDIKLDSLIFSMQGLTKEDYNNTRIGADYDTLANTIKLFHRLRGTQEKPYLTLTTTIDDWQTMDKDKFINYWKLYVDQVKIGRTNRSYLQNTIILNEAHPACYEPFRQLSVNWNGDVTACCGDFDGLLVIGNIHDHTLDELWNHNPVLDGIRSICGVGKYNYLTLCSKCDYGSLK